MSSGKGVGLNLGISTCPNDTFIFQNLIEGKVKAPCPISVEYTDVQTLNERVLAGTLDIAKISCAVYPLVKDNYKILDSGGAMGYGCGPLLLSSENKNFNEEFPVYLPGKNTTATALFNFWHKKRPHTPKYMRFNKLYHNLCEKKIKQGVTIHEHRFTWQRDGLHLIADLGAFWEQELKAPIPLGCVVVKRSLGEEFAKAMDLCIQDSLRLAWERKEVVNDFIRELAQIDDDAVILQHIKMFVNEYSMKRGIEGEKAMEQLFDVLS
ncbi:MAG: 1,4-dihydroxy-6-naphthoate synthase [Fibromonadaceae bacterium]|jgi:1,4-dihydroxy-6-naphthoate synthase|nr:1,4-dihydroxy-6-naphthoate synthase [Fibromonadaceae bacterium]